MAYARQAPPALRPLLVDIYGQLGRESFEAGLTALLDPDEDEALRHQVLRSLGHLPSLTPAVAGPVAAYFQAEQLPELRQAALELLCAGAQSDPGVLSAALEAVVAVPDEAGLLRAFANRLGSVPGAVDQLQGLFPPRAPPGSSSTYCSSWPGRGASPCSPPPWETRARWYEPRRSACAPAAARAT